MKFRPLFSMGDLTTHGVVSFPYSFCITHDKSLNVFGASWAHVGNPAGQEFIGDDIHPEVGLPHFKTMEEAVQACEEQLQKMVD
jgi:hypothetical protein